MPWTEDGGGLLTVSGANSVHFSGVPAGSKGNAMWSRSGTQYCEFTLTGPVGAWVGVTTPSKFSAGWRCKGLYIGGPGNTSDGGGLVAGNWGPAFGHGDVVGLRIEQTPTRTTIAVSKNGEGLGVAFDIAGELPGPLHPAVSLDEEGQAITIAERDLPPLATMLRAPPAGAGVEGKWSGRYGLTVVAAGARAWDLHAKVGNSLGCRVAEGADGALRTVGGVRSTMMMPPPDVYELEREVARVLGAVTALRRDGAGLVLEGAGAVERFGRSAGPGPATRDSIHWLNE